MMMMMMLMMHLLLWNVNGCVKWKNITGKVKLQTFVIFFQNHNPLEFVKFCAVTRPQKPFCNNL